MNQREKFLIILLAAVIILLGGFKFLIEPKMKKIADLKTEYVQAQSDKQTMEQNRAEADKIVSDIKDLEDEIKHNALIFFPELQTDSLHIFFQDMADRVKINYESFTMTGKTLTQIAEHQIVDTRISYPAKDAKEELDRINQNITGSKSNQSEEKTADSNPNKQPADLVEMITVSLQFQGTHEQGIYQKALDLIDQINKSRRMVRILSLDMTRNNGNVLVISITAECFGVAKMNNDLLSQTSLPLSSGKNDPFYG